jgi:hypothetical protein
MQPNEFTFGQNFKSISKPEERPMTKKHLFFAFTNPVSGREDEYNKWQKNVHLPDGLKNPGFTAVKRYKLANAQFSPQEGRAAYVNVWEIESDNLQATLDEAAVQQKDAVVSDALDFSSISTMIYTLEE